MGKRIVEIGEMKEEKEGDRYPSNLMSPPRGCAYALGVRSVSLTDERWSKNVPHTVLSRPVGGASAAVGDVVRPALFG